MQWPGQALNLVCRREDSHSEGRGTGRGPGFACHGHRETATVTEKPYELTADVIEPTQANFISREDFLRFLGEHGEAAVRVAQQLGETYHSAIAEMRTIGLSHSAGEKLARFLLDLCADHDEGKGEVKLTLTFTHEEIAQMIGASRETVTRVFADFKRRQLLQVKGSTLIIKNKAGLESVVGS